MLSTHLIVTRTGAVPRLTDTDEAAAVLEEMLFDPEHRERSLRRQASFQVINDATGRCLAFLATLQ